MSSPRSPKMGDVVDKQLKYQMEKMEHELEMEKVKVVHLEDDNERLKQQLADGEKRHKKIDKVHAMIKEFQIQIEEATEEIHRLEGELEAVKTERDEGFAVRDAEIERLKGLLGQSQQSGTSQAELDEAAAKNSASQAYIDQLKKENDALTKERDRLKERLMAAKQELQKLQIQIDLPALEGDIAAKSPSSKVIKALEERVKQLETSLASKNKYILDQLKRG